MSPSSAKSKLENPTDERVRLIRAALEGESERLLCSIKAKVRRVFAHLSRHAVEEQASEILNETAARALARPEPFDPTRSAYAWLQGISFRVIGDRLKAMADRRRPVLGTDLGEEAWANLLNGLNQRSPEAVVANRIDLREALVRLDDQSRKVLECHYFQGLGGEELARAIDAPTAAAARVRVCRALQRLRDLLVAQSPEVS